MIGSVPTLLSLSTIISLRIRVDRVDRVDRVGTDPTDPIDPNFPEN